MWCHLCKKLFNDPEIFSAHIMKKHRLSSTFNEDSSDSEHSQQDETCDLEMNDQIDDDNSDEDFFSDNIGSKNKSRMKAATPRRNVKLKTKKVKFNPRSTLKVKINPKLSVSRSNQRTKSIAAMNEKLKILRQLSNQRTNQPVLSVSCLNELDPPPVPHKTGFDFDSQNILSWLQKFKEMYKKFTLPLESKLFDKIKTIHKEIFDNYSGKESSENTSAVLKVYEELDWLIHRHINSINESL